MTKAVIYARVSTESQAEDELPILGQVEECRKFAISKAWEVVGTFKDEGYSGRTDERPAFQEMITRSKEIPKPFDIILSWRSNRLFRSVEHRLVYHRLLRRRGIKFVAIHEPEFEGASAVFMETVLAAADELYAAQVAEDTLRGLKQVAMQGYSTGGLPPTGYRNVRKAVSLSSSGEPIFRTVWEPDPEKAPKVKKAFELAAGGATSNEICQATKVVSNKSSLSSFLRNRAYLGERIYNRTRRTDRKTIRQKNPADDIIITPGAHEPIISQGLFDQVQAILDSKRPKAGMQKPASRDYLLSGILWCKQHQALYAGHSTEGKTYYICGQRKKLGKKIANCPLIKKDAIENFVLANLKEYIFTRDRVKEGLSILLRENKDNLTEDAREREQLNQALQKAETELQNLYDAIKQGISPEALSRPIEETRTKKMEIQSRLRELKNHSPKEQYAALGIIEVTDDVADGIVAEMHRLLSNSTPQELKLLLSNILDKIEISGRELTIWYTIAPCQKLGDYWRPRGIASSGQFFSYTQVLDPTIFARGSRIFLEK